MTDLDHVKRLADLTMQVNRCVRRMDRIRRDMALLARDMGVEIVEEADEQEESDE